MSRIAFQYADLCRSGGACEHCAVLLREGVFCPCQGFGCDCGPGLVEQLDLFATAGEADDER